MIDYINATVVQKGLGYIVVDCNNIGYKLLVSQNTSYELELDKLQTIYTNLIVKEDSLTLIGFSSLTERDMFEILIGVSKIGAKIALSILSTYTAGQIANFVKTEDIVSLSKISGLGKKTAQRLVLELKDKVDVFASSDVIEQVKNMPSNIEDEAIVQTVEALVNLGFSNKEAKIATDKAYELNENQDVSTLIKTALSILKK